MLRPLGDKPGRFVEEVLPELDRKKRKVYAFEANCGFQFDNAEAKGFLDSSFTVEIYMRLDNLESWRRVLDFKNRKSDNGCYIYQGKLNFFNFATGEKAPVKAGEYVHYVYSRDANTQMIRMYVDGESKIEFRDPDREGALDRDQVLNFFQDDLSVNHEASSGAVAFVRIYNQVMTPVFVRNSFRQIARSIDEPRRPAVRPSVPSPVTVQAPAPVTGPPSAEIYGRVYDSRSLKAPSQVEIVVRSLSSGSEESRYQVSGGEYRIKIRPAETYRVLAYSPGFETNISTVRAREAGTTLKMLISMKPENFSEPMAVIPFEVSNDSLSAEAMRRLDEIAVYLQSRPDLDIKIDGHTNNVGDFDKNVTLSKQRAEMVRSYLVTRSVSPGRITTQGYGPVRPLVMNTNDEARRMNRRVEVWAVPSSKR